MSAQVILKAASHDSSLGDGAAGWQFSFCSDLAQHGIDLRLNERIVGAAEHECVDQRITWFYVKFSLSMNVCSLFF